MFDHVTIRASDRAASERFYDVLLPTLQVPKLQSGVYAEWGEFSLAQADDAKPTTRRLHVAFFAQSRNAVDEFWRVGTEAGYRSDGEPGPRPQYSEDYYGGFLLDPDGNSVEAVHHGRAREVGSIDHLWIRVADVGRSTAFFETIAAPAGIVVRRASSERTQLVGDSGSFSVVTGEPTENVHLAFPAQDDATVDEFHRVATRAGYPDDGPPGERSEYHAGYYGAFVLDPDGNSVEVVNHNRS